IKDGGSGAGIVNNIFYNNGTGANDHGNIWSIDGDSGTPSYNYIYPAACGGAGGCKTGTKVAGVCFTSGNCPGWVNIAAHDFHLRAGSPAINSGTSLADTFASDADGNVRGRAGAWGLGPFEL